MASLIEKVRQNLSENELIRKGDRILVAFSGGPDSTALLHILNMLSRRSKFSISACYINHKIRPRAAKKEIRFCESFCADLKIPFTAVESDIPEYARKNKLSVEEAGRHFRRQTLPRLAGKLNCSKVALGHHLDDLVETVLFRMFRGTGPGGLDPIRPVSGIFIRPFCNVSRQEIEIYLKKNKIPFMLDRSNLQTGYSRNYIRHRVLPAVEKHFGPKYQGAIYNFAKIVAEEDRFLSQMSRRELLKIAASTPGGKIVVDLNKLAAYDVWLRRRMIKQILEDLGGHPGMGTFEEIERAGKVVDRAIKAATLTGNIRVAAHGNHLYACKGSITISKRELQITGVTEIPELASEIICTCSPARRAILKAQKGGRKVNVDYDKISQPLFVRSIKPGDRLTPLGMRGTKKVSDFLTDAKVPGFLRDEIPVLADRQGIIWLVGHRISDRVKIDGSTRKILTIELRKKRSDGNSQI